MISASVQANLIRRLIWPNKNLASLAGRVCLLRIDMKYAKLFSFWFK